MLLTRTKDSLVRLALGAFLAMAALETQAFLPPSAPQLPNFDKREADQGGRSVSAEQKTALAQWQSQQPQVRVDFDPVIGSPKWITAGAAFLGHPQGASQAVVGNDPLGVVRGFLLEHGPLFGFGPETLEQARVSRDFVTSYSGLHTVVWEQQLDGIPLFEAVFISHTTKDGGLVNLSSQFLPDPAGAADRTTPDRAALEASPPVSAARATAIALRNAGEDTQDQEIVPVDSGMTSPAAGGAALPIHFQAPRLLGAAEAKLVWLPMNKDSLRLCWEVVLTTRGRSEMFQLLVDAQTGEALVRHSLTAYISDATYRVYTSDSPSPFSPGNATPVTNQPPFVSRALIVTNAFDTNASPNGWIDDGVNETRGNNVDAHTDRDANNTPDLPRPQGSPFRVFDFTLDLAEAPSTYTNAAVTQLFFLCNWYHDRLYELGFTEAAGNFQNNNFGRGGVGNDAVQADAQDGSGFNNANFSTPGDGSPGRMQMFVFTGPTPDRDGDLDAEIVFHEHTHGLSNRRVGGGIGLSASQSTGMGEGWSDFYGLSLLSEPGDDVNGNYAAGGYATLLFSGLTNNYYFGIRRYPYTTDMTKNPLTFKDIDGAQASTHPGIPRSPVIGSTASEVHNQGEVWCVTLWEARANLVNKYGFAVGNQLMLQLTTDGMNLSPGNPTFLQSRDAILAADLVDTGGANRNELWAAFAKRGMGASATSPASSTTTGVHEAFDVPDNLQITPQTGFTGIGPVGGPFVPNSLTLALTNAGVGTFNWSLINTSAWLTLSPTNGTLVSGGPGTSVAANLTPAANALPQGIYVSTVVFSNQTSHITQTRVFTLRAGQPDFFTQLFDTEPNDLAFRSLTFTPNGSANFYAVCSSPAVGFPSDPSGGTTVVLADDSFVPVTLAGANTVSIYGIQTNVFYIASNGYLTLNSGDVTYIESLASHFNRPRVAALFDDLNPSVGGTISWKQFSDHVAVTYQNVPEFGTTTANSFQIELFAAGRIRITYLGLAALDGLAGLSAGTGLPGTFQESDLSAYATCSPPFLLVAEPPPISSGLPFNLTLTGKAGDVYAVEATTNLSDWAQLGTVTNSTGSVSFTDTNAVSLPSRVYRGRLLP